jgi:AmmeMemoRadiSam system protein A
MYTLEQGTKLVKLARKTITALATESEFSPDESITEEFSVTSGCFVTVYVHRQLRGCIGYLEPKVALHAAIKNAAEGAASRDYRFPSIKKEELPDTIISINLLTPPVRIVVSDPDEYAKYIEIGKDGLIIRNAYSTGLLLPQVARRHNWDPISFLKHTCQKAGLDPDDWRDLEETKVEKFQSQLFEETSPGRDVIQTM